MITRTTSLADVGPTMRTNTGRKSVAPEYVATAVPPGRFEPA
jgi:hypothetical protein